MPGTQNLYCAVESKLIRAAAFRHTFIDRETVTLGRNLCQFNCWEVCVFEAEVGLIVQALFPLKMSL